MNYDSQFPYAWRFIDDKYNKLPMLDLNQIDELTMEESLAFWNENISKKILYYPISNIIANNEKIIKDCGWGNKEQENITGTHIAKLLLNRNIYFFWDPKHAVRTTSNIFLTYWSDFCYCSDSANIIYLSPIEIFIYHEDIFLKANIQPNQNLIEL